MQTAREALEVAQEAQKAAEAKQTAAADALTAYETAKAAVDKAKKDLEDAQKEHGVLNVENLSDLEGTELGELAQKLKEAQDTAEQAKKDLEKKVEDANKAQKDANKAQEDANKAKEDADQELADFNNRYTGDADADTGVTIDDQVIPLASGPVTRAQFIDYLWRHEGSPAAEGELFADHEYAPAIAWALSFELIDETFQPDELMTVADVRAILGSFAQVFGTNAVSVADLTTLTGGDGEAVMNCDQVLAEFFGEEYLLPEDLDSLETDDAA